MFAAALLVLPTFLSLNSITQTQIQPLKVDGTRLEYSDGSLVQLRGIDICSLEWTAPASPQTVIYLDDVVLVGNH